MRGFESHPLRHKGKTWIKRPDRAAFLCFELDAVLFDAADRAVRPARSGMLRHGAISLQQFRSSPSPYAAVGGDE
ncbi:hypothetical protein [Paenibacillus cisolokensis]|uniref:hypothetical protein n=1 Tax=Paenibacillus cisolokensis TaxID=1658519 RepID=UPI001BD09B49|nr:hypothetical protein [Paenibacillus cisolokensis]